MGFPMTNLKMDTLYTQFEKIIKSTYNIFNTDMF